MTKTVAQYKEIQEMRSLEIGLTVRFYFQGRLSRYHVTGVVTEIFKTGLSVRIGGDAGIASGFKWTEIRKGRAGIEIAC